MKNVLYIWCVFATILLFSGSMTAQKLLSAKGYFCGQSEPSFVNVHLRVGGTAKIFSTSPDGGLKKRGFSGPIFQLPIGTELIIKYKVQSFYDSYGNWIYEVVATGRRNRSVSSCVNDGVNTSLNTGSGEYTKYYNPRFEYSVTYPAGLLRPQPVAANGDGREFLSPDNQVKMLVYGTENGGRQTLGQKYNEELNQSGRSITYKLLGRGMFAISGYQGDSIFYQKTIFRNNEFLTFSITYPISRRSLFDSVTSRVANSFK